MSKIELEDTLPDIVVKMSEGNPGAISALLDISSKAVGIDPDSALGALGPAMTLYNYEIYGSDIYIIYNDKCDRNARKMLILLRATQLGIFPVSRLKQLSKDQMREKNIDPDEWDDIESKVFERLEKFDRG